MDVARAFAQTPAPSSIVAFAALLPIIHPSLIWLAKGRKAHTRRLPSPYTLHATNVKLLAPLGYTYSTHDVDQETRGTPAEAARNAFLTA